jgi:hypothetical protein
MPLSLASITANKNHTMVYGSIHLLKYYSYSANSCTFLTRASIGVISNSQHMFCSVWHAKEQNLTAKHAWRFLHALLLKPQTHIPYQIEIYSRDFTRVDQLFCWLPTYFIRDIKRWGCVTYSGVPRLFGVREQQTQRSLLTEITNFTEKHNNLLNSLVFGSRILSWADNRIAAFIIDPTHSSPTFLPFGLCRPGAETPLAFP